MDTLIIKLPTAADQAGRTKDLALVGTAMDQRVALLSAQDSLKATLTGLSTGLGTAFDKTARASLAGRTLPRVETLTDKPTTANVASLMAATTPALDELLQVRVDKLAAARDRIGIMFALAMALALYLFLGFFSSVRSSVARLAGRLRSLSDHDTAALRTGLETIARRDLTFEIAPVTEPIADIDRDELGEVARAVNAVRDDTVASVLAYNATRAALAEAIGQVAMAPSASRAPRTRWRVPPSRRAARSRRSPTPSPTSPAAPSARSTAPAPPARPPTMSPPPPSRASPTRRRPSWPRSTPARRRARVATRSTRCSPRCARSRSPRPRRRRRSAA